MGIIAATDDCHVCLEFMQAIRCLTLITSVCVVLSGCSSQVAVPDSASNNVTIGSSASVKQGSNGAIPVVEPVDLVAEEAIAKSSLEAWRKGLAGDVDGAMKQLEELNKKYPKAITVRFMMGQVLDHSGRKAEAVKHYREAVKQSQFNRMYIFKLAESLRTTGDAKGAAENYRELLALDPTFAPAKVGLAKALWMQDKDSQEARKQVEEALAIDPTSKDAKSFLAEMDAPKPH